MIYIFTGMSMLFNEAADHLHPAPRDFLRFVVIVFLIKVYFMLSDMMN